MATNPLTEKTTKFLLDLRKNNSKKWFDNHRKNYETDLLKPFKAMVDVLAPTLINIDRNFEVKAAVNKTISRIHRDIRFSKDKSPYKSNMWISFRIPSKEWKQTPVFFFELMPPTFRYGMGFYMPEKSTMDQLRKNIDDNRPDVMSLMDIFDQQDHFTVQGDDYKRILNKELKPEHSTWYQKKGIFIAHDQNVDKELYQDNLIGEITDGFNFLTPYYHYFWKLKVI